MNTTNFTPNHNNMSNTMNNNKRISWVSKFFWRCAGADIEVLQQCPTSHSRYTGIGATVFFTAVMAFISMTYALTTVFFGGNMVLPVVLGLTWALMIFSLDRFIVNSMHTDESEGITRDKFKSGLPRLVMAIFIGIVVSTPLELRIFEQKINAQLVLLKEAERDAFTASQTAVADSLSIAKSRLSSAALTDSLDIIREQRINADLATATASLNYARSTYSSNLKRLNNLNSRDNFTGQINSLNSTINSLKNSGADYSQEAATLANLKAQRETWRKSNNWYAVNKAYNASANEVHKYSARVDDLNNSLTKLYDAAEAKKANAIAQIDADKAKADALKEKNQAEIKVAQGFTGLQDAEGTDVYNHDLLDRMEALHTIMAEHPFTAGLAVVFIALMFFTIESAPTLFKMMMAAGAYEKRMAALECENRMASDTTIYQSQTLLAKAKSDINDQINTAMDRLHSQLTKELSDLNDELNTAMSISAEQNRLKAETAHKVNEATYQELARAQAEIIRQAIAGWKEQEMQRSKEHPEDYPNTTNVNPGARTETETSGKKEQTNEKKEQENVEKQQQKETVNETADEKEEEKKAADEETDQKKQENETEPQMKDDEKKDDDWSKAA